MSVIGDAVWVVYMEACHEFREADIKADPEGRDKWDKVCKCFEQTWPEHTNSRKRRVDQQMTRHEASIIMCEYFMGRQFSSEVMAEARKLLHEAAEDARTMELKTASNQLLKQATSIGRKS